MSEGQGANKALYCYDNDTVEDLCSTGCSGGERLVYVVC